MFLLQVRIQGEGMPVQGRPYSKGNMYIRFTIQMPTSRCLDDLMSKLQTLLPDDGESEMMDTDEAEEVKLSGALLGAFCMIQL